MQITGYQRGFLGCSMQITGYQGGLVVYTTEQKTVVYTMGRRRPPEFFFKDIYGVVELHQFLQVN